MNNPFQQLFRLPWLLLFLNGLLTILCVAALEFLLGIAASQVALVAALFNLLYAPVVGVITAIALAFGIGILAVYLLEKFFPEVPINAGTLWALLLCLLLAILAKLVLPLPVQLVDAGQLNLIGIMLGIFWRGRRYWRY